MNWKVAPSILSADFGNLQADIKMINESQADWFHVDIMDGNFVPNISFGMPILSVLKKHAQKPLDVHVMMVQPERYIDTFIKAGADHFTLHVEACVHLDSALHQIKNLGAKAGVALNPSTPVESLFEILHLCDIVCVMSVNPGFGGQKFIEYTHQKIKKLKAEILKQGLHTLIEVDGGVTLENVKSIRDSGADVVVAGNTVFSAASPTEMISTLKNN